MILFPSLFQSNKWQQYSVYTERIPSTDEVANMSWVTPCTTKSLWKFCVFTICIVQCRGYQCMFAGMIKFSPVIWNVKTTGGAIIAYKFEGSGYIGYTEMWKDIHFWTEHCWKYRQYQKTCQIKVVENKISKKNSLALHVYRHPEWSLGARKIVMFQIL